MRQLSASELLRAWETGLAKPAPVRTLSLLSAAIGSTEEELARLSIGRRDAKLLELRRSMFGSSISCVAGCPACGERLEVTLNANDLSNEVTSGAGIERDTELSLETDRYRVRFRLPDSNDLSAAARIGEVGESAQAILARCVSMAELDGRAVPARELPRSVAEAVATRMAEADPEADVQLDLTCPACNNRWQEPWDVESFFWSEMNTWAPRILKEVHELACAYGWRESDILNLSSWRREFYLTLIAG